MSTNHGDSSWDIGIMNTGNSSQDDEVPVQPSASEELVEEMVGTQFNKHYKRKLVWP